jgi:amino-acid N-acetyltransferase
MIRHRLKTLGCCPGPDEFEVRTLKPAGTQLHGMGGRRTGEDPGERSGEATDAAALRQASEREMRRIEQLLAANDLPHEDLSATPASFFVATDGGDIVGIGGIEAHGSHGLLRSVVVPEPRRGQGHGTRLLAALEERARAGGIEVLYLLTTTAPAFFRRRGYEEISRESVPPAIQQTREFSERCPASATCLRRRLQ